MKLKNVIYHNHFKELSIYFVGLLLCISVLFFGLSLFNYNMNYPPNLTGDGIFHAAIIKNIDENGWIGLSTYYGAPGDDLGYVTYQNPYLQIFILKLLIFCGDWASTLNWYFLISFPLTTIIAIYVLREFNLRPFSAITGSLLFTFLPYHFLRGISHLLLSDYFLIPLAILLCYWIYDDRPLFIKRENDRLKLDLFNKESLLCILFCICIAGMSPYYAFFSCFFILFTAFISIVKNKDIIFAMRSGIPFIAICSLLYISLKIIPFNNHLGRISNLLISQKFPWETEIYGLKFIQLLLPIPNNVIPAFASLNKYYNTYSPLVTENATAALGIVGSIGFIILLIWIFIKVTDVKIFFFNIKERYKQFNFISSLNLIAFLFGTIGGLGTLFAFLVVPNMRSVNRISLFIAFFSILSLLILIEDLSEKIEKKSNRKSIIYAILMCSVLFIGIGDEVIPFSNYYSGQNVDQYNNSEEYYNTIETLLPENSMVLQLPVLAGVELKNQIQYYEYLKPYLFTSDTRWTFFQNNESIFTWLNKLEKEYDFEDQINIASSAGFNGILIDSYGYSNSELDEIVNNYNRILNQTPMIDDNNRMYFYDLQEYKNELKQKPEVLIPIIYTKSGDWQGLETSSDGFLQEWFSHKASIEAIPLETEFTYINKNNSNVLLQFEACSYESERTLNVYYQNELIYTQNIPGNGFIEAAIPFEMNILDDNEIVFETEDTCGIPNNSDARCLSIFIRDLKLYSIYNSEDQI